MHNLVYNIIDCSISFENVFDLDNDKDGLFAYNKEIIFYENFEKMLLVKGPSDHKQLVRC